MKTILNAICYLFGYRAASPYDLIKPLAGELKTFTPTPQPKVFVFGPAPVWEASYPPEDRSYGKSLAEFIRAYDAARRRTEGGESAAFAWDGPLPIFTI